MSHEIYFSKIVFQAEIGCGKMQNSMLLDIHQHELAYQVLEREKQKPAIMEVVDCAISERQYYFNVDRQKIVFSYGIKLTEAQIEEMLPLCNTLEFEPYRSKEMSMNDEGCIGYRDEIRLRFIGITDSYIPKMEWEMPYYYDEEHIWPSEKLYRYLVTKYFQDNKELKNWVPSYGESSLFI